MRSWRRKRRRHIHVDLTLDESVQARRDSEQMLVRVRAMRPRAEKANAKAREALEANGFTAKWGAALRGEDGA